MILLLSFASTPLMYFLVYRDRSFPLGMSLRMILFVCSTDPFSHEWYG